MADCAECGKELREPARGRRPRYCSRSCQARAYRARAARREGTAPPVPRRPGPDAEPELSRERIVRAAIALGDAEGLAAVSMRRVAVELGAGTMSLYRYVSGKEELVTLMVDEVFADRVDELPAEGRWRERVEACARLHWEICRRHPWVVQTVSVTRPALSRNGMRWTEAVLSALDGLGLSMSEMLSCMVLVNGFVQGVALLMLNEIEAQRVSGMTNRQWWDRAEPAFAEVMASGDFPVLARAEDADFNDGYESMDGDFEFGLERMLDGLAVFVGGRA